VSDDLLDMAIEAACGKEPWSGIRALRVDASIDGPVWGMKGWPKGVVFRQILTLDTVTEHIRFSPFTRPDWQMVFDGPGDRVTVETRIPTATPSSSSTSPA
jgi:hypothetical protein